MIAEGEIFEQFFCLQKITFAISLEGVSSREWKSYLDT